MKNESRVHKTILNAKVNLFFYMITLIISFVSRKIFLDCLGAEFIGLVGTLGNILGYLNLAEFGILNCISFLLFKPLQTDNRRDINEILSVLGYLYLWIGIIILFGGIVVSAFFPLMFDNTNLGLGIVYFSFFSLLSSSLIGYFINYRQIILTADQKNYLVAVYLQSFSIFKVILQVVLAYNYKNLYIWVGVEFLFSILGCIVLNWKINKVYPWLKTNIKNGKMLLTKYPAILKNTKQIFIHKIKDFLLTKSDELFVFVFVSLKMVAYYGNYILIITKLTTLFSSVSGSVGASIGNLVAENNKKNIMKIFWEYVTIQHTIAAVISFSIYSFLEPFIFNWLGPEYVMDHLILVLLVIYIYITNSRTPIDIFNHAYGHYADVWAAWVELIINVSVTIFAGLKWGIVGILLGKIISLILIVVFWKPYYLFSSGFKQSISIFWRGAIKNYLVSLISFFVVVYILSYINIDPYQNFICWGKYAFLGVTLFLLIDFLLTYIFANGSKDLLSRFAPLLGFNRN